MFRKDKWGNTKVATKNQKIIIDEKLKYKKSKCDLRHRKTFLTFFDRMIDWCPTIGGSGGVSVHLSRCLEN